MFLRPINLCSLKIKISWINFIDPQKVVPDELHLFLRISDILLKNLIDDCKQLDSKLEVLSEKPHHVQDLVDKIRECGVPFNVWSDRQSGEMQWTSLSGNAYKKLHLYLPEKLLFHTRRRLWDLIYIYMSRGMGFPTMWYVRPAKPQISLRIRADWSKPLPVSLNILCVLSYWLNIIWIF